MDRLALLRPYLVATSFIVLGSAIVAMCFLAIIALFS